LGAWQLAAVAAILGVIVADLYLLWTNAAVAASVPSTLRRKQTWLIGGPVVLVAVTVGAPYAYTHLLNGPAPRPLTFADLTPGIAEAGPAGASGATTATAVVATTTTAAPAATGGGGAVVSSAHPRQTSAAVPTTAPLTSLDGTWSVGSGTQAGYSVDDTVMGQSSRVVGRTSDVSGTMQIAGSRVMTTDVTVNMQTVTCHCVHDAKYQQMLETNKYPTSQFVLTQPISLAPIPPPGAVVTETITGNFTIHGVTRSVSFQLKATRIGNRVAVNGSIPVNLSDYNIQNPNNAMGGLSNCDIDLLIAFDKTA
jgi:polyisoprenoid-binding protein YceI